MRKCSVSAWRAVRVPIRCPGCAGLVIRLMVSDPHPACKAFDAATPHRFRLAMKPTRPGPPSSPHPTHRHHQQRPHTQHTATNNNTHTTNPTQHRPPGDGGVIKTVVEESSEWKKPGPNDEVVLDYSIKLKGSPTVIDASSPDVPAVFDLSEGAPLGLKGVEVAVRTMKRGERVQLKLRPECERRVAWLVGWLLMTMTAFGVWGLKVWV